MVGKKENISATHFFLKLERKSEQSKHIKQVHAFSEPENVPVTSSL